MQYFAGVFVWIDSKLRYMEDVRVFVTDLITLA